MVAAVTVAVLAVVFAGIFPQGRGLLRALVVDPADVVEGSVTPQT